jgi:hypothetical protein
MDDSMPKDLNIAISEYDNRWNKVAAELAKTYLTASYTASRSREEPQPSDKEGDPKQKD